MHLFFVPLFTLILTTVSASDYLDENFQISLLYNDQPRLGSGDWNQTATRIFIKTFEELKLIAYKDLEGVWTIGWGHRGPEVIEGYRITKEKAEELFDADLFDPIICVSNEVKVPLNPNQNGALISFTFSVGCDKFRGSNLLKRLNNGENPKIVVLRELPKWVYIDGKKVPSLVRRRAAEVLFFWKKLEMDA